MGLGSLPSLLAPAAAVSAGYLAGVLFRIEVPESSREAIAAARQALHTCGVSVDALRVSSGADVCRQALEVCGDTTSVLSALTASSAELASRLEESEQDRRRLTLRIKLQLGLIGFLIFVIGIFVIYIFKGLSRTFFVVSNLLRGSLRRATSVRCPTCSLCQRRAFDPPRRLPVLGRGPLRPSERRLLHDGDAHAKHH
jgi:hypothetical protein